MKTQTHPSSLLESNSARNCLPVASPIRLLAMIAAIAFVLLASAAVSRAASGTWNGSTDVFWTNALNWSASPAPGAADTATFSGGGNGNTTIDLTAVADVGNIHFDTASVAPYTIGAGGAGSQSLTLDLNGSITMSSTVTSNQVLNANLFLPTLGFYNIVNNSATNILTLAGTNGTGTFTGSAVLTVDGTGTTAITGPIAFGTNGAVGLQKTNSGTLILSGGGYFSATNVNSYLPGVNYGPVDLRSGTTIISSGLYTNIGEFVVGGVIADGGAGKNVNLTMNGGSLNVSTWFSLGRGNGVGGVSSDLVLNNNASITSGNISCGFNVNVTNQPKGTIALNNSSSINISGNGLVNFAESAGSAFTMTLNNSAQFNALGTGVKSLGFSGNGTLTLNDSSMVNFGGNGLCYVGHNFGTGAVTVASSSAGFFNGGELQIGGSDQNGTGRNANGTFTVNAGTVGVGALTIGRGNNNQNGVNGVLYINGGTVTSTNDVLLAFAGATNTSGRLAMNGGTLNVGTTVVKWLRFGQWDFTYGMIDITNGNLNLNSGTSIKFDQNNSTGPKIFSQYGGNVTFYSDFATTPGGGGNLDLMLVGVAACSNVYNFNGGTLTVPQIWSSSTLGTRIFNFNGGTLRAATPLTPFMNLGTGAATVNVRNGGAIIDANGNDIAILSPLVHSTIAGDAAIDGGLTKLGNGTLTLSANPTYTGPTIVLGGGLSIGTGSGLLGSTSVALMVSNATLSLDVSSGNAMPANNVTLNGSSNNINVAYGSLLANPATPAINASGTLSVAPTNIINITATGLKPGTFTLIKYATGTLSGTDFANIGLTLPPGVFGTLVNNTGNKSIDLNVTAAPNFLTWNGVNGANWDIGTTASWTNAGNGTISVYQQYTNGSVIVGDGVNFDDTLTNDFASPQPTNVNLTGTFYPYPVIANNTKPYTIAGAGGITGSAYLTKTNTGTLTLLTSNNFTGGATILGGQLIITNDFSLGASSGLVTLNGGSLQVNGGTTNTVRPFTLTGAGTIGVASNVVARYGGVFSGSGGLTKTDLGTLTLAGANTYVGNTFVNSGTLVVDSGGRIYVPSLWSSIGQVGSDIGTLTLKGTGIFSEGGDFNVGDIGNADGTLNIQDTATLNATNIFIASANAGSSAAIGIVNQSGGTVNQANTAAGTFVIGGRNAASALGVGLYNLSGGTVNASSSVRLGSQGSGTLNQSGGTFNALAGGINLSRFAGAAGTYNLNGGTFQTLSIASSTGIRAVFNFNGGTLKAFTNNNTFFQGLNGAIIYSNGATIDDNGKAITIAQPLLAPTGDGVNSIQLADGGSGYISPPIVTISDSFSGSNATATATVNPVTGTVTGVTITCPGGGFDPVNSFLSVNFQGGGPNPTQPNIANWVITPNPGTGGLTKKGSGTLTLNGVNTFTGPITNLAGTLVLNSASTYSGAISVNAGTVSMITANTLAGNTMVSNNASLIDVQIGQGTNNMGNLTVNGGAAVPGATLGFGLTGLNSTVPLLNCGALTINGTNTISVSGGIKVGAIPLLKYTSLSGSGNITNLTLPQGATGYVSNYVAGSTLYAIVTSTGPGLVWTGTNTVVAGVTNLWDINTTTNWLLGATPTSYRQPIIPGDSVQFNDSGLGLVILNTNAGPASMIISNNSTTYTFRGTGSIIGSGGLTKVGTGTAILGLANAGYTGNTTISNGTLMLGSATALSSGANLNIGPNGTLEMNGFAETVGGAISGTGTIDNSSSTNATLTISGGGTWNGTIHDQGLGGGVQLSKIGNNTLIIGGTANLNSTANPAFQPTAGITIITNNGAVNCGTTEYWISGTAGSLATNIVDGGSVLVNNWLVIGRGFTNANGTLIVNNGTVQKAGGNNIVVGSLNATGVLTVNGGQILNNGDLWLGENPLAIATLNLNGGLIQADVIRGNNQSGGLPTTTGVANFNGGTLQATANSTNFLQVVCMVQNGGLVLDDNGFTLSIGGAVLQNGGSGGLLKKGSGAVYLDLANNSYTGDTVVSNGTLAGIGSVAGNAVVPSTGSGNLGAGDAATNGIFTIGGNLTLQKNTTLRVNKTGGTITNDQVAVTGTIAFGGVLDVQNITSDATPLAINDQFQVFSHGGSGNFSSIVSSGATYSFNPATGVLTVLSIGPGTFTNPTGITSFSMQGANVVITASNGQSGDAYYLLESTNVAKPLPQWKTVATNVLTANGSYTFIGTNVVVPGDLQQFYILSNTNYNP